MWKPVVGFENMFEVSDDGRVRSLDRTVYYKQFQKYKFIAGKEKKLSLSNGYYVVNLNADGKRNVRPVHRLVAQAFIDNPLNLPCVNHIDGDKTNNNVSNLEWVTYGENNVHALVHNLRQPRGNALFQLDLDGNKRGEYKSMWDAFRKTGVSVGMISHCVNHRYKTAGGFVWVKESEFNDYPDREYGGVQHHRKCAASRTDDDIVCPDSNVG